MIVLNPRKKLNTWSNTYKAVLFIIAIILFLPIEFYLIYPTVGAAGSIILYFAYLIVMAILIRRWAYNKFGREEFD